MNRMIFSFISLMAIIFSCSASSRMPIQEILSQYAQYAERQPLFDRDDKECIHEILKLGIRYDSIIPYIHSDTIVLCLVPGRKSLKIETDSVEIRLEIWKDDGYGNPFVAILRYMRDPLSPKHRILKAWDIDLYTFYLEQMPLLFETMWRTIITRVVIRNGKISFKSHAFRFDHDYAGNSEESLRKEFKEKNKDRRKKIKYNRP